MLVSFHTPIITDPRTHHRIHISHPVCGHVLHHLSVVHWMTKAGMHVHVHHVGEAACSQIGVHGESTVACPICLALIVTSRLPRLSFLRLFLCLGLCSWNFLSGIRSGSCDVFACIPSLGCTISSSLGRRGFNSWCLFAEVSQVPLARNGSNLPQLSDMVSQLGGAV